MIGRTISHYLILGKLGEGGMGVVYKARDTHLDRFIAIKVLPPEKVADAERRARFVQEAKAASALNHPHIITIYDIDERDGVHFIAMEHVEGKTLADLTGRKGLPLNLMLKYGVQIADALSKAHAKGIIHRDLKPTNVMITADGAAKVLDFGLAKLTERQPDEETVTLKTAEGTVMGTAAYMSPEQIEGKPLDARSDIFSFGAVLYEMLTGQRAFHGDSRMSILSAVLRQEPAALGEEFPHDLRRVILRCLRKDPARRFQGMPDVKVALEELAEESSSGTLQAPLAAAPPRGKALWFAGAAAAVIVAAALAWWMTHRGETAPQLALERLTYDTGLTTTPAISLDGKLIAYASDRSGEGGLDIWVQHRSGSEPIRITRDPADEQYPCFSPDGSQIVYSSPQGICIVNSLGGTPRLLAKGGMMPRFSPDGKQIAYATSIFNNPQVFVVDVAGGQPRRLLRDFTFATRPIWSPDGKRLLVLGMAGADARLGLWIIPATGGAPEFVGEPATVVGEWLPGDLILYTNALGDVSDLRLGRLSDHGSKIPKNAVRLTASTGYMMWASMARDGTTVIATAALNTDLWSLPLDADAARVTGQASPLTQDTLRQLYPSITTDGGRLVYQSGPTGNSDIWLMDTGSRATRPLTVTAEREFRPIISPDGSRVAYTQGRNSNLPSATWVLDLPATGSPGLPRKVCEKDCGILWDWSSDNRGFLLNTWPRPFPLALLLPDEGKRLEYVKSVKADLWQGHFSPDGRWMVLLEDFTLMVLPVREGKPAGRSEWRRVVRGGDMPRWSPDGNTLYFRSTRDSHPCIYAQRLDRNTKTPVGEVIDIAHSHAVRHAWPTYLDTGAIGLALAKDRLVYSQADQTGNIWLTRINLDNFR